MFITHPHVLLALHHTRNEELRAQADADRLARSVRRRREPPPERSRGHSRAAPAAEESRRGRRTGGSAARTAVPR